MLRINHQVTLIATGVIMAGQINTFLASAPKRRDFSASTANAVPITSWNDVAATTKTTVLRSDTRKVVSPNIARRLVNPLNSQTNSPPKVSRLEKAIRMSSTTGYTTKSSRKRNKGINARCWKPSKCLPLEGRARLPPFAPAFRLAGAVRAIGDPLLTRVGISIAGCDFVLSRSRIWAALCTDHAAIRHSFPSSCINPRISSAIRWRPSVGARILAAMSCRRCSVISSNRGENSKSAPRWM